VGAQTGVEANALRGPLRRPRNAVKQVGPSNIRPSGSVGAKGSVKVIGTPDIQDRIAAAGDRLPNPATRQAGSVKQVGPADVSYTRLTQGGGKQLTTAQKRYAPKSGDAAYNHTPLLKSGVGRAHQWSQYAGQPGSMRGGISGRGASAGDILISGRKRSIGAEPFPYNVDWVTPTGPSVVPGS
jgi:hypothetical protein